MNWFEQRKRMVTSSCIVSIIGTHRYQSIKRLAFMKATQFMETFDDFLKRDLDKSSKHGIIFEKIAIEVYNSKTNNRKQLEIENILNKF